MRKRFIFYLLLCSLSGFSQDDTAVAMVTGNCWGNLNKLDTPALKTNGFVCKTGGVKITNLQDGLANMMPCCGLIKAVPGFKLSCPASRFPNDTLLIVDEVVTDFPMLSKLNPRSFENITVLSAPSAMAIYGSDGMHGAIIITTKGFKKLIIKDHADGSPIARATVLFTSVLNGDDQFQMMANDSGVVVTEGLKSYKYKVTISAAGYKSFEQFYENSQNVREKEILLCREIKSCDEVILTNILCPGRKSIGLNWSCGISGIRITIDSAIKEKSLTGAPVYKIYPNPVQKGAFLNLQIYHSGGNEKIVRVISTEGKNLLLQTIHSGYEKNLFQFQTDPRWPAGTYIVQLLYENGMVAASEKVIIQ